MDELHRVRSMGKTGAHPCRTRSQRPSQRCTVTRQFTRLAAVFLCLTCTVCGKKTEEKPEPAVKPTGAGAANATSADQGAVTEAAAAKQVAAHKALPSKQPISLLPDIAESDVIKLLETWVKAQNAGDFETYASLYAERFHGTKRSGTRSRTFQRRAWLRDRKRMFGKAMQVEATEPEVLATAGTARLLFEQSWASGRYKDIGPKQLVVVRERGELKIAREEMLQSVVDNSGPKASAIGAEHFGFVVQDGGFYLVLNTRPKRDWADGKRLRLLQAGSYASVTSPAKLDKIPATLTAWRGRKVALYGPQGEVCRGQAVALAIMARVRPHFGTVQYWRGDLDAKPDGATVAREAWRLGDTGRLLVARLLPMPGHDCRAATWGRSAEETPPKVAAPIAMEPIVAARAMAELKKLKGFELVQQAFVAEVPLPRALTWDAIKGASVKVTMLGTTDASARFVSVAISAGDGCGDFQGDFWAIWRVVGEGKTARLQLLTDDTAPGRLFVPRSASDMDADGRYEFLGSDALLQPAGPILRHTESIEVPSLDCPC